MPCLLDIYHVTIAPVITFIGSTIKTHTSSRSYVVDFLDLLRISPVIISSVSSLSSCLQRSCLFAYKNKITFILTSHDEVCASSISRSSAPAKRKVLLSSYFHSTTYIWTVSSLISALLLCAVNKYFRSRHLLSLHIVTIQNMFFGYSQW